MKTEAILRTKPVSFSLLLSLHKMNLKTDQLKYESNSFGERRVLRERKNVIPLPNEGNEHP